MLAAHQFLLDVVRRRGTVRSDDPPHKLRDIGSPVETRHPLQMSFQLHATGHACVSARAVAYTASKDALNNNLWTNGMDSGSTARIILQRSIDIKRHLASH